MGGDLSNAPKDSAPSFMIRALRDPDGANLDRVQVIKGWFDKAGKTHERVYDVTVSDGRKIGDPFLAAHRIDPDFDAKERAFYYVRVIERPTPPWTAYDAKFFGVKMTDHVPMTTQERAYTSPIWCTP